MPAQPKKQLSGPVTPTHVLFKSEHDRQNSMLQQMNECITLENNDKYYDVGQMYNRFGERVLQNYKSCLKLQHDMDDFIISPSTHHVVTEDQEKDYIDAAIRKEQMLNCVYSSLKKDYDSKVKSLRKRDSD